MSDAAPYSVPKEPGRWRALLLAAAVHAVLIAFLWFGVRWQNDTPVTVEAEVWDQLPQEAAKPAPEPEPAPEQKIEPKPEPQADANPKPQAEPMEKPAENPDIALEQEKKKRRQEEEKRERDEKLAKEKAERRAEEKRRVEQAKAEAARKLAEKEKTEALRKAEAEKKRKQEAADAELLAKIREEETRRIHSSLAGSGNAARTQGQRADADYAQRLGAKIKSNTVFDVSERLEGNPAVEYQVELLPDGSLRGTPRKLKSSGIPGFDGAVLRAIEKSQPFPPDKSGNVPSVLTVSQKPKD